MLRTALFFQDSPHRRYRPSIKSPPLILFSLADVYTIPRNFSFTVPDSGFSQPAVANRSGPKRQLTLAREPGSFRIAGYGPSNFRLGGLVLEGSVVEPAASAEMEFVITDLITDMLVRYQGSLPDLFREGHSVVVEGFVKPFTDEIRKQVSTKSVSGKAKSGECYFSATGVLAKHDE
ncbi:cytochrome c-type biogenesis protein CcmE-like [Quillaja saponaria]|uniref:Cytochrome c-type biogenesis protein CcmE-like n=1 Tax=Quillaja saponaria TaxID=32244 RepID=A0AAD7PAB4_QUISA|nr:cytochrome c-type biogenesis protein CcmE-like [Quillaja saponaria]